MTMRNTKTVIKSAIISRIIVLTLTIIWRSILSPYDTSASINPNCLTTKGQQEEMAVVFPRVGGVIENGVVWDSVYFVRIAECGYEYEQTYAFLPLFPLSISLLSRTGSYELSFLTMKLLISKLEGRCKIGVVKYRVQMVLSLEYMTVGTGDVLKPLIPLVGHRAVLALSGYLVSNISFVFAALFLYRLSVIILKDSEASLRATILFCFNPASIFYSSIYSESLYALLSIGGLYFLMSGANNLATLWFALSGCVRSNGVLNAGYIGFLTMHRAYDAVFLQKRPFLAFRVILSGILRCIFVFIPFVAFQAFGYYNLCYGRDPDKSRPWCNARIPLLYNFIQSHYWGVGFLRYFQLKQLPNFLLASPILSIALCSIIHYVKLQPSVFLTLGFQVATENYGDAKNTPMLERKKSTPTREDQAFRRRKRNTKEGEHVVLSTDNVSTDKVGKFSVVIIPFILHLGFMVATAFFVMHVQVSTRFLSASPPIYWFASYVLASPSTQKGWRYVIWGYCAFYILIGSLLFSNFYPFT
ncbi:GPI mannosyltransferase 2 isoform X1 [Tanacetum coccineum]